MKTTLFILLIYVLISKALFAQNAYEPTVASLKQYEAPDWFRDAKFGIWAVWGPQTAAEHGDWYARIMYLQGVSGYGTTQPYEHHVKNFGHPSEFGFKDLIPLFTAENWNPDKLMKLYKRAGAKYFVSIGQHHDNFDMWDSKLQPWNAVNMGPKRDFVKDWQQAAYDNNLNFGVSFHGRAAWHWFESSRLSDIEGPKQGVPYDGWLTKEDGKGKWWEGYDPRDLYCMPHKPRKPTHVIYANEADEDFVEGAPEPKYYEHQFKGRVYDIIENYQPELLYFDSHRLFDTAEADYEMIAYFYNESSKWNSAVNKAVVTSKGLSREELDMWTLDYENSHSNQLREHPWQTDIAFDWWIYYKQEKPSYMSTKDVVHTLIDIVSKNGNMLLNICLMPDGELPDYSYRFLDEMEEWMDVNSEAIHGTRPWVKFGEGSNGVEGDEVCKKVHEVIKYTSEDFRFTTKGDYLYAFLMDYPVNNNAVIIKSLSNESKYIIQNGSVIRLLGYNYPLKWKQTKQGLIIEVPKERPCMYACALKIKIQ